jgi:hypothetical protein
MEHRKSFCTTYHNWSEVLGNFSLGFSFMSAIQTVWSLTNVVLIPSPNITGTKVMALTATVNKNGIPVGTLTVKIQQDPISGLLFYSITADNSTAEAFIGLVS